MRPVPAIARHRTPPWCTEGGVARLSRAVVRPIRRSRIFRAALRKVSFNTHVLTDREKARTGSAENQDEEGPAQVAARSLRADDELERGRRHKRAEGPRTVKGQRGLTAGRRMVVDVEEDRS